MEKLFHARWWDYSAKPLNIDGRVWIPNALAFGAFGVIIVKIVHPIITSATYQIPDNILTAITISLSACILTDFIYTLIRFSKFNTKIALPPKEVFTKINKQERRMIKAFPKMQPHNHNTTLQEIRKYLSTKKKKIKHK